MALSSCYYTYRESLRVSICSSISSSWSLSCFKEPGFSSSRTRKSNSTFSFRFFMFLSCLLESWRHSLAGLLLGRRIDSYSTDWMVYSSTFDGFNRGGCLTSHLLLLATRGAGGLASSLWLTLEGGKSIIDGIGSDSLSFTDDCEYSYFSRISLCLLASASGLGNLKSSRLTSARSSAGIGCYKHSFIILSTSFFFSDFSLSGIGLLLLFGSGFGLLNGLRSGAFLSIGVITRGPSVLTLV